MRDLDKGPAIRKTVERRRARLAEAEEERPPGGLVEAEEDTRAVGLEIRHTDCDRYRTCLDYAVRREWENFDCRPCPHYWPTGETVVAAADIMRSVIAQRRSEILNVIR